MRRYQRTCLGSHLISARRISKTVEMLSASMLIPYTFYFIYDPLFEVTSSPQRIFLMICISQGI